MARVLIVDDEPGLREVIRMAVMRLGHEALCAPDGEAGYALAREYTPHLIVSDVNMPSWSGLDLLHAVRGDARLATTTVVLITGAVTPSVSAAPAFAVLPKPFQLEALEDLVCAALARSVVAPRSLAA
ncbi:MAG: response regulator [Polyangiaceae bacterium]|nr:response regulator [Polyangiaceae bacterium]